MPTSDRPSMPDGYGIPATHGGLLTWDRVEPRLVESKVYWMATTRPDGRPHVMPRWGVWVDGKLWYDGSPHTVHAQNLTSNPNVALHLEDGTRAVIVEGTSHAATPPPSDLAHRLSAEFIRKYAADGYSPGPDSWSDDVAGGLSVFTAAKALAWFSFPTDVTRFRFE